MAPNNEAGIPSCWRSISAICPRISVLFAGTIAENICRFVTETGQDSRIVDAAIVAAAKSVGVHDQILRLSGGYDHKLQSGGRGLSAGEAQRVALARAAFGVPSILVLDEPNARISMPRATDS